jgi:glucose/arabinose dehydrogenase
MTTNTKTVLNILLIVAITAIVVSLFKNALNHPVTPTPSPVNEEAQSLPGFTVPEGYKISKFANVPGARDLLMIPEGILVSETNEGKVALVRLGEEQNGEVETLISGLNRPHGLAIQCPEHTKVGEPTCYIYIAEQGELVRYSYNNGPIIGNKEFLIPFNSSTLDRHFTRSLLFLPPPNDDILLISFGSSCNVCNEKETDYASIESYNINTKKVSLYAKGLRNAVFMALRPDNKVYATEMGRDSLGDDLPPDEINIIEQKDGQPKNYGWPNCYGKNIHDTDFDHNTYIRNPCMEPFETPSFIDLPAHSAPLGLTFMGEDLLVAYHGSWNRSVPTGYKVVRIKTGETPQITDYITGWTTDGKLGRPVDLEFVNNDLYISDDAVGVIYKLEKE